jgi:hypothetical protein
MRRQRALVGVAGMLVTGLLHSLLFVVAMWGDYSPLHPRPSELFGAGANAGAPEGQSRDRMIMVQLGVSPTLEPAIPRESAVLLQPVRVSTMLEITGPDALPVKPLVASIEGESEQASEADLIARTRLAGIYEGQIRARIERAWLRPREAIGEPQFNCRVSVRQHEDGSIEEIELEHCNGSWRWQMSLANAVFAAAPLPAPPDPNVFVDAFSIAFRSEGFREDQSDQGFETESSTNTVVVAR